MSAGILNKLRACGWVAVGIAIAHLAWVAALRFAGNRDFERRPAPSAAAHPDFLPPSGSTVRILQFYASPVELTAGQEGILCYGVQNARSVRLDPAVDELKPAWNRCLAITPEHDTTYTLRAEGFDGAEATASFQLKVNPAPPYILFVALSDRVVNRGHPLTMCYGVTHATAARLDPIGYRLAPIEKACVRLYPPRTTDFTLVASDNGGRTDREKFRITVK